MCTCTSHAIVVLTLLHGFCELSTLFSVGRWIRLVAPAVPLRRRRGRILLVTLCTGWHRVPSCGRHRWTRLLESSLVVCVPCIPDALNSLAQGVAARRELYRAGRLGGTLKNGLSHFFRGPVIPSCFRGEVTRSAPALVSLQEPLDP